MEIRWLFGALGRAADATEEIGEEPESTITIGGYEMPAEACLIDLVGCGLVVLTTPPVSGDLFDAADRCARADALRLSAPTLEDLDDGLAAIRAEIGG